jgi:hypothetical protein
MLSTKDLIAYLYEEYGGLSDAMLLNDDEGICFACGNTQYGVESNAHNQRCYECGEYAVFGIEEVINSVLHR